MDARDITHKLDGAWRNGSGQAPCPICQPERRKDQNALAISDASGKLLLHCFKSNCSFVEIATAAGADLQAVQIDFVAQREHEQRQAQYSARKLSSARGLWAHSKPIQGTHAERYLRGRGITCSLPDTLRFVSDIYHGPSASWSAAMVADVSSGGVHRTFFDKSGCRVSKSAKMMLGPCAGGAVRLSGSAGPLIVCEGIETGLSLLSGLLSDPCRVFAALSTSGIQSLSLPEQTDHLIIATDGDTAGRGAASKLATRAHTLGWQVSLMPAPEGKDFNDVLRGKGG